jgi:hypothetical protein
MNILEDSLVSLQRFFRSNFFFQHLNIFIINIISVEAVKVLPYIYMCVCVC